MPGGLTGDPDRIGAVFFALGDPTRRSVLERLGGAEAVSLSGLAEHLPMTRQAVAKHLKVLESADLVTSERSGRETHYRIRTEPMSEAAAWMARVGAQWDARLSRLQRLLAEPAPRG